MKQLLSFNQTIRTRLLLNFFAVLMSAMVMPYTIVYFSAKIGLSLTTTMIIIIGIISIIGYLVGGNMSDKIGRKSVIIFSEVLAGIGFIAISYFDMLSVFYALPILISFSFIYFFQSLANPAYGALIIDASDDENRKIIYTYSMWFSGVAFAIGSLIGGFFFEKYSSILFILVGITSLISALCSYFFIIEDKVLEVAEATPDSLNTSHTKFFSIFLAHVFLFLCIGELLINLLIEQFPNYLSIRIVSNYPLDGFTISGYEIISFLHVEDTIVVTLLATVILTMTKKLSNQTSLLLGLSLLIIGYVLLSYFLHPIWLLVGMLLIAVGGLIYIPTLQTIKAAVIPANSRGTHLSVLGLIGALGGMLSSLFIWGKQYLSEITITWLFIIIGLLILLNYIIVYRLAYPNEQKEMDNIEKAY
jgi:MFS transporter, DHA1 family, multidrug resistance protein B